MALGSRANGAMFVFSGFPCVQGVVGGAESSVDRKSPPPTVPTDVSACLGPSLAEVELAVDGVTRVRTEDPDLVGRRRQPVAVDRDEERVADRRAPTAERKPERELPVDEMPV